MKDNEWVSVLDQLPKIGEDVFIKSLTRWNGEYAAKLKQESFCGTDVLVFRNGPWVYMPTHWRYPVEKRPDFSKLMEGDLLIFEWKKGYQYRPYVGYLIENGQENLLMTMYKKCSQSGVWCGKEEITKITRINLEEQTFEEI